MAVQSNVEDIESEIEDYVSHHFLLIIGIIIVLLILLPNICAARGSSDKDKDD